MSESGETWSEDQDKEYAQKVLELYEEGHEEFEIEELAAAQVNEGDTDSHTDSDTPN
jgi:hypothetical protein